VKPPETCLQPDTPDVRTIVGSVTHGEVLPVAVWPMLFAPQHQSVPSCRVAQVVSFAVVTEAQLETLPIRRGRSWVELLDPQHQSEPSNRTPQRGTSPATLVNCDGGQAPPGVAGSGQRQS